MISKSPLDHSHFHQYLRYPTAHAHATHLTHIATLWATRLHPYVQQSSIRRWCCSTSRAVFQPLPPLPGPVAMHSRQHKSAHSSPAHHHGHREPHHHRPPQPAAPRGMIHADALVMEQWVDGPKVSRSKISEARHLKREVNRNKNSETWIDGPRMEPPAEPKTNHRQPPPAVEPGLQLPSLNQKQRGYGFMDTHKKSMIRRWVENQTSEVMKNTGGPSEDWEHMQEGTSSQSHRRASVSRGIKTPSPDEEDEDSGPSDVPPALQLIDKSCSSKASEKDYGFTAQHTSHESGGGPGHPLSALSFGNMSTVSSFHHFEEVRIQPPSGDKNMDQLARIRELFTSQLALAEVNRVFHFCKNDTNSIYSEPVHKLDGGDLDSACSEPILFHDQQQMTQPSTPLVIPNQPQRPTELATSLLEAHSLKSLRSITETSIAMHLRQEVVATVSGGESNLEDLHLEYPFVSDQPHANPANRGFLLHPEIQEELARIIPQPPPVLVEPYDSGHDSTPRTSKHSGFSRRAESGYHSISVTVHDESEVSSLKSTTVSTRHAAKRDRRLLCLWLRNPFNCTKAETEAEVSDF